MGPLLLLILLCTSSLVSSDIVVGNEVELQNAVSRGDNITLSADISIKEEIFVNSSLTLTSSCGQSGCKMMAEGLAHRHFTVSGARTTFTLQNVTLLGGSAPSGGAVFVTGGAGILISSVTFNNNAATGQLLGGGAIELTNGSTAFIVLSTFTSNNAAFGGAIEVSATSKLSAKGCVFNGNQATVAGGAINVMGSSSLVLSSSVISGCTAPIGGAINVASSTTAMCGSNTTGNSVSLDGYGAEVLSGLSSSVSVCRNVTPQVVSTRGGLVVSGCDECEPTPGRGMHPPGHGHHPPGVGHHPRTRGHRAWKRTRVPAPAAAPAAA